MVLLSFAIHWVPIRPFYLSSGYFQVFQCSYFSSPCVSLFRALFVHALRNSNLFEFTTSFVFRDAVPWDESYCALRGFNTHFRQNHKYRVIPLRTMWENIVLFICNNFFKNMGLACKKTSDSKSICEFMGWKSGHNQMSKLVYMGQIRVDSGSIRLKRGHLRSKWALILPKIAGRLGKDSHILKIIS